ncbi:MAG: hypothetical protein GX130_04935 [Candidatus Hydrogenedens sp.]|nr:hypothetical protein [Candidatus Hydrogenedens sp.]
MTEDLGYIDYRTLLELQDPYKPADVIRTYRKKMKQLMVLISEDTEADDHRDRYLLQIAELNAAYYILRNKELGRQYIQEREELLALETEWRTLDSDEPSFDAMRRRYDQALRAFLARYMEELILEAGRDPECVEHSGWSPAHERFAGRVLRQFRQQRYHEIHERLPYYDITKPEVDWEERARFAATLISRGEES